MRRALPVVALVASVTLLVFAHAAVAQAPQEDAGGTVTPGDRVTGVVQVQQVELDNSVETAEFESRYEALGSDEDRAALIANRLEAAQRRAREIRTDSGRTPQLAAVAAEVRHLREVANESREMSERLPPELVEEAGIPRKIESLNDRLDSLESGNVEESLRVVEGEDEAAQEGLSEMDLRFVTDLYESGFSDAPRTVKGVFGDERVNVHVRTVSGETKQFYIETEGGVVVEADLGEGEDATLRVETHENVLRRISSSNESSAEFVSALRSDDIEYQGLGALSRLKYGFVAAAQFLAESVSTFLSRVWVF